MQPNNRAFNHKLFHIFNYAEITKYYKLVNYKLIGQDLSVYRASALRLNHIHRSLSFDFSFSPWVPLSLYCVSCVCLCKLIYNLLLLFISNLKIASTWADWLTIKYCNNYLPNNLASKINSTTLHCQSWTLPFCQIDRQDLDFYKESSTDLRVITFFQQLT